MAQIYWAANYWSVDHWTDSFWAAAPPPEIGGNWSSDYFASGFWADGYWSENVVSGTRTGVIAASLDLLPPPENYLWWHGGYFATGYFSRQYFRGGHNSSIFGTSTAPSFIAGVLVGAIANVTSSVQGNVAQVEPWDVSVDVGPAWVDSILEYHEGAIAGTLDDVTSTLTGSSIPAGGTGGMVAAVVADITAALSGTHVAPPNRSGILVGSIANVTALFDGRVNAPADVTGPIVAVLADVTATITGTYLPIVRTATIAAQAVSVGASIRGGWFPAGWISGPLHAQLAGVFAALTGSVSDVDLVFHRIDLDGVMEAEQVLDGVSEDEIVLDGVGQ